MLERVKYPIPGMFYADFDDNRYFFTDKMLANGVFIALETIYHDDNSFEEWFTVKVATDDDYAYYIMTQTEFIEPIQVHHMLKDIKEIFDASGIQEEFTEAMDLLSGSSSSASMQTDISHRHEMIENGLNEISFVRSLLEEAE
jgi:hypothetical protein